MAPCRFPQGNRTHTPCPAGRGARGTTHGPEGEEHTLRPYEVVIVFDVGVEPQAMQAALDRYLELVKSNAGTVGQIDRWGRRPLAYEIKHKREGYYVVVEFNGESKTVEELDRNLRIADEVIRHKVVRLPDQVAGRRPAGAPAVAPS